MSIENLWGDLPKPELLKTPAQILREQAKFLTEMTLGVLLARVTQNTDYVDSFAFDLSIRAPALNNYTVSVVSVVYDIHMYPLKMYNLMDTSAYSITCSSEKEFVAELAKILKSDSARRTISALLVQSNGVKPS